MAFSENVFLSEKVGKNVYSEGLEPSLPKELEP